MKRVSLILSFILILSTFTFTSSGKASTNDVRVGVLYYPWYNETGNGKGHWSSRPEWMVVDVPYFGYYSCLNSTVINRQLDAMHVAGVDFVLLSWWGNATWCGLNEDTACHYVFDAIKQNHTDMQAFLMVDDIFATPSNVHASDYSDIYNYINESYLVHYSDYYFKLNGKPVLGWWACSGMTDNITRRRDWVFNSSWTQVFEVRTIGHHHDYNEAFDKHWYGWTPSTSTPNETELTFGQSDGFIFIEPRYDDTYKFLWGTTSYGTTKFNQNLTGGYEAQWQAVVDRQTSYRDVQIVCIYSWNSYDERSAIEPETDYTVPNVDSWYLLNKTKDYISILKDTEPPTIGKPYQVPSENVTAYQNVTISANVSDYGIGVNRVLLNWTTNVTNNMSSVHMTFNSVTLLYEGVILGKEAGTSVSYSITAYDNAENCRVEDNQTYYYNYVVIQEFSPLLVLPLFMLATLAAVKVYKRKTGRARGLGGAGKEKISSFIKSEG